jgi:5S rRNA maturation endonuclease (ribonuclease M5)
MKEKERTKYLFEYQGRHSVEVDNKTTIELKDYNNDKLWPWDELGISVEMLKKWSVYPIEGIMQNGRLYKSSVKGQPIFGMFRSENSVKVYFPRPSDSRKFIQFGEKPEDWIFGWNQLPRKGRICFICAGEKDTVVMNEIIGYPAISPNSESAYGNITEKHIEELKSRYSVVCVMFDNDKTGLEYSKKISNRYKLINIQLPKIENGKDLADYIKKGMSIQELRNMIEDIVLEPDSIWDENLPVTKTKQKASSESQNSEKQPTKEAVNTSQNDSNYEEAIDRILFEASKEHCFESGRRNGYILYVSSVSNTRGIPLNLLLEKLEEKINLSMYPEHLKTTIGTYERYKESFNSHPFVEPEVNSRHETPVLDTEIIKKLPLVFQNLLSRFSDEREKDVATFGLLTLFGAILKGYSVIHKNQRYLTNLFVIIAAPFASGKGTLNIIRIVGNRLHKKLLAISAQRYAEYQAKLEESKKDSLEDTPEEPIYPRLYLPGDISAAGFKEQLYNTRGSGLMFDTEADTISSTLSMEWGDYSVLLRKGLSNEVIEFVRKNVSKEIEKPYLSGLISGTIGGLLKLIPNSENGLFSRLIYYTYSKRPSFATDAFDYKQVNRNEDLEQELAGIVEKVYFYFEKREKENFSIDFYWKEQYQVKLVQIFTDWLNSHIKIIGEEGSRVLFRLANMASRIAAILTVFRLMEKDGEVDPRNLDSLFEDNTNVMIPCCETDFEITCHLMDIIRQHSMHLFENLQEESENKPLKALKTQQLDLWHILPKEFQRKEAISIGVTKGIKERTVDKYLKVYYDQNLVKKDEKGNYTKLK